MNDNLFSLDLPTNYEFHELVFINSGSNYYSRIPLNEHAALFAGNNEGKTSSLAALKLFLLPEINFKDCENKFGFESGGKYFTTESSFRYYFPSTESYIICHASNPKGHFCWVLFRTTNFGYQRIAIPCAYEDIEYLFWNSTSKANEGAGQLQPNIAITDIKKELISKDFSGTLFTDKQSIGEAIYTRTSSENNHTRYSLLPMANKFTSANVETVRALVTMAFNLADASTTTLPKAIGNMIDGRGMSVIKDDGIIIDISDALAEWDELKETEVHLSNVKANLTNWSQLKTSREQYLASRKHLVDDFSTFAKQLASFNLGLSEESSLANEQVTNINTAFKTASQDERTTRDKKVQITTQNTALEKNIAAYKDMIALAESVEVRLAPLTDNRTHAEISTEIQNQINSCNEDIASLKNQQQAQENLVKYNQTKNTNLQTITELNAALDALENNEALINLVSEESRNVLLSLNKVFSEINGQFDPAHIQTIEAFTNLFSVEGDVLTLCGQATNIKLKTSDVRVAIDELVKQIDKLEDANERLDKKMLKHNDIGKMSAERRQEKLTEENEALEALQKEQEAFNGLNTYKAMLANAAKEHEALAPTLQAVNDDYTQKDALKTSLREQLDTAKNAQESLKVKSTQLEQFINRAITQANNTHKAVDYDAIASQVSESADFKLFNTTFMQQELDSIKRSITTFSEKRRATEEGFQRLLSTNVIEVKPEDKYQLMTTQDTFNTYYSALESVFETLDAKENSFKERLKAHNNNAATSARIIENVADIIESEIAAINTELAEYKISNLEKVQIKAELHPQYLDMIKNISRYTGVTDNLISDEFYKQISAFQQNFYIRKSSKINIPKIIESISYMFMRGNEFEAVPQSNGTNSMINAVMLAQLFKRLVPEDLNLTMPVIFDEVGKLDKSNLREILKAMQENGLILFAANPAPTGVIVDTLAISHDLSIFKATDVDVHYKAEAIYFGGMEERLENIETIDTAGSEH